MVWVNGERGSLQIKTKRAFSREWENEISFLATPIPHSMVLLICLFQRGMCSMTSPWPMRYFLVASTTHCSGHMILCYCPLLPAELEQDLVGLQQLENISVG